jgi:hypothetical protein
MQDLIFFNHFQIIKERGEDQSIKKWVLGKVRVIFALLTERTIFRQFRWIDGFYSHFRLYDINAKLL